MVSMHGILIATVTILLSSPISASFFGQVQEADPGSEAFQKVLDDIDPSSLHAALHDYSPKQFQHGVFPEDRTALEAIHRDQASVASSIIDLAKRQAPGSKINTTAVSNAPSPETHTQPTTRPTPVPLGPSETTTSNVATSNPVSSNGAPSPSSAVAASTSTPVTTSAPAVSSSYTNGQVITMTDASGRVVISTVGGGATTITPGGQSGSSTGSPTSVVVSTSTLPDGSQSLVTAVTVVQGSNSVPPTPSGTAGTGTRTAGSNPGLQTGQAVMSRGFGWEGAGVLVGALGFAAMM